DIEGPIWTVRNSRRGLPVIASPTKSVEAIWPEEKECWALSDCPALRSADFAELWRGSRTAGLRL
ncbi:MAG: hypothetical protein AABZ61_08630, partial [Bacteroidota bacterium]